MALARAAGNRVVVATATRGERGTADEARWPLDRLARLRSDELAASLAVLGVVEHPGLRRITPLDELAVRLRLSRTALERKLAALKAHASQVAALHREVGHERIAAWWSEEAFWAAPDGAA
jgi:LmbE family N-acetylglucosaminyl deacetylase